MKIGESSGAFAYHILSKIDPEIMDSFTQQQLNAVYQVIVASRPQEKHPIDVRAVIPLFFFRIYVVFLMGRDKRPKVQSREAVRRRESDIGVDVFLIILGLIPIFLLLALVYYFLKVEYGIDYIPDFHLTDLIN
jgi:hypothetical protein